MIQDSSDDSKLTGKRVYQETGNLMSIRENNNSNLDLVSEEMFSEESKSTILPKKIIKFK